jgi:hypothetical protein
MSIHAKVLPSSSHPRDLAIAAAIGIALLGFTGCGTNLNAPDALASASGITGTIHGGQQPVAFATVTLYAAGITGYGSAPTLLTATTSNANGNFTLVRPYACVAGSPVTYIVASNGDSGQGVNTAIGLAALLPACSDLTAATTVEINEVSTIAAAYALAPFATVTAVSTNIGTSAKNVSGLANALGPNSNLVDTSSGIANAAGSNPDMVLPEAEINTLANILASCVNTGPKLGGGISDSCTTLFTDATPPAGAVPANTFQAALDIALNPGNNNALLFGRATASAPFQPTLAKATGDFALSIQYTGGQIYGSGFTTGMAIDSKGNAWVGNGVGDSSPKSVSKISPAGVFLSGTNGYLNGTAGGNGYSIDSSDNVFIAVAGVNSVYELNQTGATINTFSPSSFIKPTGLAVDNRTGAFWAADTNNQPGMNDGNNDFTGNTVSYVKESTGLDAAGSPYGAQNGPFGVEIDGLGNVWIANTAANTTSGSDLGFLSKFTPPSTAGNAYTTQNFNTGAGSFPFELAFDSSNNVWTTLTSAVAKFSNAGALLGSYTSVASNVPTSIMMDGLGRAFVSNATAADFSTPGSLTVFSPTGTLLSTANAKQGYLANNTINSEVFGPTGLAIDGSGDVWITGINTLASAYGFVTEIIGIAAPITTPTTVESSTNTYGTRP